MLYNRNWNKPDVLSMAGLIAWLETKDPEGKYEYCHTTKCLCAQYFKAKGYYFVMVNAYNFRHGFSVDRLPAGFNEVAVRGLLTFGAALERARNWHSMEFVSARAIRQPTIVK